MSIDKLRYSLTNHIEKYFFTYENLHLLIHPSIPNCGNLLNELEDDIKLIPKIEHTKDKINIEFYRYNYNENIYSKSELLAFILASINKDWNVIKGIDLHTCKSHFWLKHDNIIFDPSLSIITDNNIYLKKFKQLKEIKNGYVRNYLSENNNLYKFYEKGIFKKFHPKINPNFSINFINTIIIKFNKNIEKQYILDNKHIKDIKEYFWIDNFIELRQVLSQKRKSYLQSNKIAVHPSIDDSILKIIEKDAKNIHDLMKQEYDMYFDYYNNTLGNCYGLSIMLNLYNENFKLVQGGIPYKNNNYGIETKHFYQHSWLEQGNIVYDPALRIITPKDLYYIFVEKQDEYSKSDTENILRRIGFNLTHFRDFMNGVQIGGNETFRYKDLLNKIDTLEMKEQGEKLISTIEKVKRY